MSARFDHEGSDKANAVEQSPTPIATTPILPDDEALKVGKAKEVAAGIPAVVSATKHAISEMGVARGMKMLLEVNQMGGFDCPGCA
ncbi:MAG: hypothetical protein ACK4XM_02375, partial [Chloroherpetonaceae bacterium]